MFEKIKKEISTDKLHSLAAHAGVLMMTTAAGLGVIPMPHEKEKRAIVPNQAAFAYANESATEPFGSIELRREREEVHPQSGGGSVHRSTPNRAGRA